MSDQEIVMLVAMTAFIFGLMGVAAGYSMAKKFAVQMVWRTYDDKPSLSLKTTQRIVGQIVGKPAEWCFPPDTK